MTQEELNITEEGLKVIMDNVFDSSLEAIKAKTKQEQEALLNGIRIGIELKDYSITAEVDINKYKERINKELEYLKQ